MYSDKSISMQKIGSNLVGFQYQQASARHFEKGTKSSFLSGFLGTSWIGRLIDRGIKKVSLPRAAFQKKFKALRSSKRHVLNWRLKNDDQCKKKLSYLNSPESYKGGVRPLRGDDLGKPSYLKSSANGSGEQAYVQSPAGFNYTKDFLMHALAFYAKYYTYLDQTTIASFLDARLLPDGATHLSQVNGSVFSINFDGVQYTFSNPFLIQGNHSWGQSNTPSSYDGDNILSAHRHDSLPDVASTAPKAEVFPRGMDKVLNEISKS